MQCQVRSICRHLGLVRIQVCKAGASESHKGPQELQLEQLTYARPDEGGWSQESAAAHPALPIFFQAYSTVSRRLFRIPAESPGRLCGPILQDRLYAGLIACGCKWYIKTCQNFDICCAG